MMIISENISLKPLNTFGFDVSARYYAAPETPGEAKTVVSDFKSQGIPVLVLGGGSNIVFTHDFAGLVIHPKFSSIERTGEDNDYAYIKAGAGVLWDDFAAYAVERGLGGPENLSLIPGNVGAAPVQNIGAYGTEAKDVIDTVEGFYLDDLSDFKLSNEDCGFGYRDSIFKRELKGKTIITGVVFRLSKRAICNTTYGNIDEELKKYGEVNIANIRKAVINIRLRKLPDPAVIGNAGSFFKNPMVDKAKADELIAIYPDMPVYPASNGMGKLAAGKLIELCGFKGMRHGNVGVHDKQALVLVNRGGGSPEELLQLSDIIRSAVREKFGVDMEPEVNVV